MEHYGYGFGLFPFFWYVVVMIPLAVGNYYLAQRLDRPAALWAILSLIPVVNYLFFIYVAYMVLFAILDRLSAAASAQARGTAGPSGR